jgi:hypothetical protein
VGEVALCKKNEENKLIWSCGFCQQVTNLAKNERRQLILPYEAVIW